MNIPLAIGIKLFAVMLFAVMSTLVRFVGESVPLGQVVFFRSVFAVVPVVLIYTWRGEIGSAVRTGRPLGHLTRGLISVAGMFLNFAALARLPLVDATAISFAAPLITVALAAFILHERVRAYRWSAVAVGFAGVVVMLWPYLDVATLFGAGSTATTVGAACAVTAAFTNAGAVIRGGSPTARPPPRSCFTFRWPAPWPGSSLCPLPGSRRAGRNWAHSSRSA
jgi:drug/metabolite transporter (DMT)-like permease